MPAARAAAPAGVVELVERGESPALGPSGGEFIGRGPGRALQAPDVVERRGDVDQLDAGTGLDVDDGRALDGLDVDGRALDGLDVDDGRALDQRPRASEPSPRRGAEPLAAGTIPQAVGETSSDATRPAGSLRGPRRPGLRERPPKTDPLDRRTDPQQQPVHVARPSVRGPRSPRLDDVDEATRDKAGPMSPLARARRPARAVQQVPKGALRTDRKVAGQRRLAIVEATPARFIGRHERRNQPKFARGKTPSFIAEPRRFPKIAASHVGASCRLLDDVGHGLARAATVGPQPRRARTPAPLVNPAKREIETAPRNRRARVVPALRSGRYAGRWSYAFQLGQGPGTFGYPPLVARPDRVGIRGRWPLVFRAVTIVGERSPACASEASR